MTNKVQLITYVDRLAGNLENLQKVLNSHFSGLFSGVHLLPFYFPIDGEDTGFDPIEHTHVDSRIGNWANVKELSSHYNLMTDVIVNHISSDSQEFKHVKRNGQESEYWPLFLKKEDVFKNSATDSELGKILRLHPNAPFLSIRLDNGEVHDFWSTFSDTQLDINVETDEGQAYLDKILKTLANANVSYIRLDAVGFSIKRRGTSCFMLPETFLFIEQMTKKAHEYNIEVLVEIHSHYMTQIEIAKKVSWVYDFALPPLILHSLFSKNFAALKYWLSISPRNCITVLDTHDGIGIIDVAGEGNKPGLLNDQEIKQLIEEIHKNTQGQSLQSSGEAAKNLDVSQINSSFFSALGCSSQHYLIARAIQLFIPGIPQIYYAGLLAAENDMDLLQTTNKGRDINRPFFSEEKLLDALAKPVVRSLFELICLRRETKAFSGNFQIKNTDDYALHLKWILADSSVELKVNLLNMEGVIIKTEKSNVVEYCLNEKLEKAA